MSLSAELTRACLDGPKALDRLIQAKGLQLGAELNVLREVLRAIVLNGARPHVLAVLAKQLRQLNVWQSNGDTVNAITELIVIEQQSEIQWTEERGHFRRSPDNTFRKLIAAAVKQALGLMPDFNVEERIRFSGMYGHISYFALAYTAFYVYEALGLPLGNLVAQIFLPNGYHVRHPVALETLKNLTESAPFEELNAVYAGLPENVDTNDQQYNEVIIGLKADLQRRIQQTRSEIQLAMFLGIYRPILNKTRTGRRILAMNEFPVEMFHLIVDMVLGSPGV